MGSLMSKLHSDNALKETFMINYLASKGPTPYTMDTFPGGRIKHSDRSEVVREKFKKALKQQKILMQVFDNLNGNRTLTRRLSPVNVNKFDLDGDVDAKGNVYSFTYEGDFDEFVVDDYDPDQVLKSKTTSGTGILKKVRVREGFGTLGHLVSGEEIASFNVRKEAQLQNVKVVNEGLKTRRTRTRSRPEPTSILLNRELVTERHAKSEIELKKEPEPDPEPLIMFESPSEVVVEKINLEGKKRSKKSWPQRDVVRKVMSDTKNRPTTYFLGKFRSTANPTEEYVEIDYRYKNDCDPCQEYFTCTGPLETLLEPDARLRFEMDKRNDNTDLKQVFLQNLNHFLNTAESRIWWNGYLITVSSPSDKRIQVSAVEMSPPNLIFDMNGVQYISAKKVLNKLILVGSNEEGGTPVKSFQIKGKTAEDLDQIRIHHEAGSLHISFALPLLLIPKRSGNLSVSISKVEADRQNQQNKEIVKTSSNETNSDGEKMPALLVS